MMFDTLGHEATLADALSFAHNTWPAHAAKAAARGDFVAEARILRQVAEIMDMGEELERATEGRCSI